MVEENYEQMERRRILRPTNDIVFQALFGKGKERITKAMLEDILGIEIQKIDLDKNKDLLNDRKEQKNGRVDVRAVINDNVECDIEIQLATHERMIERFLYYWAKMYTSNLKVGNKYSELKKTISIIIVGEKIEQFKGILKSHTKWKLREEEYQNIVLTEFCELHIIEISKAIQEYQRNKENAMLQWMMFLDNPNNEEIFEIMKENEDIKEAKKELDKIAQDEVLWKEALDIEITRMDNIQYIEDAENRGIKKGIEKGRKEGEKKAKLEYVKRMLDEKIPIETIIKITGLTKEEIEKLKN